MPSPRIAPRSRFVGAVFWLVRAPMCTVAGALPWLLGAVVAGAAPTDRLITRIDTIWQLTAEERALEHELRVEGRVAFADPEWRNAWLEDENGGHYLWLGDPPLPLVSGQWVRLEGAFVPSHGISARNVRITVLEENAPFTPLETAGRIWDLATFDRRTVVMEGYADVQQLIDDTHLRVRLIVENRPVICWVRPDDPARLPDWAGKHLRLTGLYSARLDPTGNASTIELWVAREAAVEVVGTVATDPRFDRPPTPIPALSSGVLGDWHVVRGVVHDRQVGEGLLLRDGAGTVRVRTIQHQVLAREQAVEVLGRLAVESDRWVLADALVRPAAAAAAAEIRERQELGLNRIDEVREMSAAEAVAGRRVELQGTVTWAYPTESFFYLADLTGGVRVRFDPARFSAPAFHKYLRITGRTMAGPAGPEVVLESVFDLGARAHPPPVPVTLERAWFGDAEAQWVAMRGFIRETESVGDWRRIHLTTPAGPFVGLLNSPVNFVATPGSLLSVLGVCETVRDAQGEVTGVQLRVPFIHNITVEEEAPVDLFATPLRSLATLGQVAAQRDNVRVRIEATVVDARRPRALVAQSAGAGIEIFTTADVAVGPGQRIEAAGILGRDQGHVVLRDAVIRVRTEMAPVRVQQPDPSRRVQRELDLRLVEVEAELLNRVQDHGRTRLTMEWNDQVFDAWIDPAGSTGRAAEAELGSRLRVRGVYRVIFDQGQWARTFELWPRGPEDLLVVASPPWLTGRRALAIVGLLAGVAGVAGAGLVLLRRRVRGQTTLIRTQIERQSQLEAELERGRRLRSIGSLAGGIAHDFNNLLTTMLGHLSLAATDREVMARAGENIEEARAAAQRGRELTAQLVTLARGGAPVRRPVAFAEWLRTVVDTHLPPGWKLVWEGLEATPTIEIDPDQFSQAIASLLRYLGRERATPGTVRIQLHAEAEEEPVRVCLGGDVPAPSASQLAGMFDPYGESMYGEDRFALALAYSIVKRHAGQLSVAADAAGLTFTLVLPRAPLAERPAAVAINDASPAAGAPPEVASTSAPSPAALRVLLLEDEAMVARVFERSLNRLGHDVEIVAEGAAAVDRFLAARDAGRPFDVVVLDLTVPNGMGGVDTLTRLRLIDPEVRAVASSGYADDPVMANPAAHGFAAVLGKPYAMAEMQATLQRVVRRA